MIMKFLKGLVFSTVLASGLTSAAQMEISSQQQFVSENSKIHTYSGDVQINFGDSQKPETLADTISVENGKTIMEGNVEIRLDNAVAIADKVVYITSEKGLIAQTDKVTLTFE